MSQRIGRVADRVQREISELIRTDIKDPRLGGIITVCAVKISRDIGYADIYVTVLEADLDNEADNAKTAKAKHAEVIEVLNSASGFLRQELGRRLNTRTVPRLRFHYDTVTANANFLSTLISQAVADLPALEEEPINNQ